MIRTRAVLAPPVLVLAVLCLLPAPIRAQEESAPVDRWKLSTELSYTDQSGNRSLRLLTGGVRATHLQKEAFELDAAAETRYGESEGEVIARRHYGSLSLDLAPEGTWSPFLFADAERDRFKRLDARLSGGAGAKYTFHRARENRGSASVSLALLYSYENLAVTDDGRPGGARDLARWSLRLKGSRELRPGLSLHHVAFYQPAWAEMADYLLRAETGANVLLLERVALSVTYQLQRNALPPEGVEPDDRILKTGLILEL